MVQGSSLIRPRTVTGAGAGMVSHAGIAWLAETADLAGLTAGLSAAMAQVPTVRRSSPVVPTLRSPGQEQSAGASSQSGAERR